MYIYMKPPGVAHEQMLIAPYRDTLVAPWETHAERPRVGEERMRSLMEKSG